MFHVELKVWFHVKHCRLMSAKASAAIRFAVSSAILSARGFSRQIDAVSHAF
jgi:hypothetical protein